MMPYERQAMNFIYFLNQFNDHGEMELKMLKEVCGMCRFYLYINTNIAYVHDNPIYGSDIGGQRLKCEICHRDMHDNDFDEMYYCMLFALKPAVKPWNSNTCRIFVRFNDYIRWLQTTDIGRAHLSQDFILQRYMRQVYNYVLPD